MESIEDELKSENTSADDPQWRALDTLRDRIGLQFTSALKEAFDQIVYPSINAALRTTGIDLAFAGNQSGEATIRHTLESARKFTTKIDDDSFRTRAEARLFGGSESKVVLWSDFKRAAAVNTNWPLHKTSALDDLKDECIRRGLWRSEGNHIRRGPFPPPSPEVSVRELSVDDSGDGRSFLKVEPLHAPAVAYETGDADPTPASSPVPTPARFEATGLRYRFIAYDPEDVERVSMVKEWTAKLRLKYQLHNRGDHFELELLALPKSNGVSIRYTTDGSSATSVGSATYAGPIRVPDGCRVVCAMAVATGYTLNSETLRVPIPQKGEEERSLDPAIPAKWNQSSKLDDSGAVWDLIGRLEKTTNVLAFDISLTAESSDGLQNIECSGALEDGYGAAAIKSVAEKLQEIVGGGSLRMTIGSLSFPTSEMRRVLNAFLVFIERMRSNSIVIAATNYGERLDKALFRRFDDLVEFGLPACEQVRETIKRLLRNIDKERLSWKRIEQAAKDLSYAEITRACEEAIKDVLIHDLPKVTNEALVNALTERRVYLNH